LDKGLVGTLLRYPYVVRTEQEFFDEIQDVKVTKDMLDLAKHIVNQKSGRFSYGTTVCFPSIADFHMCQRDVRLGSFASILPDHGDFRSTPVNGHSQDRRTCLKGANRRHRSQWRCAKAACSVLDI
jgi:hypothetical protein